MITYKAGRKPFATFSLIYIIVILGIYLSTFLLDARSGILLPAFFLLIPLLLFYLLWLNSFIKIDTTNKTLSMPWLSLFRKCIDIRHIIDIKMIGTVGQILMPGTIRVYYERKGIIKRGWITTSTLFLKDKDLGDFRSQISNINPNITWGGGMLL